MSVAGAIALVSMLGCNVLDFVFGPLPADEVLNTDLELGVAIVQPASPVTAVQGVATIVQWADIARTPGTSVRVSAQRRNDVDENVGDPIHLVGDGTPGSGRDAIGDGANDIYNWDITGVRVGDYVIAATIEAPDGTSRTVISRDPDRGTTGSIMITTELPVPTLTFTAPGADDETVFAGDAFEIAWTDNGDANPEAVLTLGLDIDEDHENGNEIILLSNRLLSDEGTSGQFDFFFQDQLGNPVPDGEYTVFARLDDNANDIVTVEATGQLLLNP